MPKLDDDTVDELTWRISAAISASVPTIFRPHLDDDTRALVMVVVSKTGMCVKIVTSTGTPVSLLLQLDEDEELDVYQPCFYCARTATHRDLLTHNQVCANCAAGQSHHEPL